MRLSIFTAVLMVFALNQPTFARSISVEQSEAAKARDAVGDEMSKLSDLEQKIKNQQALIAREQEKLNQYQSEKTQTEQALEQKKVIFEQKSKALDEAWKQRTDY